MVSTRKRKNVIPPMHQVKLIRTPDFLTLIGCKCRNTLVSTARA